MIDIVSIYKEEMTTIYISLCVMIYGEMSKVTPSFSEKSILGDALDYEDDKKDYSTISYRALDILSEMIQLRVTPKTLFIDAAASLRALRGEMLLS